MKKIILSLIFLVAFLSSFISIRSYAHEHARVWIEEGNLVKYDDKILSSGVPDGVPAEEALKLFRGENAEYTIEGNKNYTSWNFGFPIDTRYTSTNRIISYSKIGGWREKSVELDIKEKRIDLIVSMFTFSFLSLLLISLSLEVEGAGKKKNLFLSYGAIFVSVIFTIAVGLTLGKYSTNKGYLLSFVVIWLTVILSRKKARLVSGFGFLGAMSFAFGNADMGSYAHLSTNKALVVYVFFIISIGAISYLTVSILDRIILNHVL